MDERAYVRVSAFTDEGIADKDPRAQLALARNKLGIYHYCPRFIRRSDGSTPNVIYLTDDELTGLRALQEEYRIWPCSIGTPLGKKLIENGPDEVGHIYEDPATVRQEARRAIVVSQALAEPGTRPPLRGFAGYPVIKKGMDPESFRALLVSSLDASARFLEPIIEECTSAGVVYVMEVEGNLPCYCADAMRIIRDTLGNPEYLRFCPDGANSAVQGFDGFEEYLKMREFLGFMHAKGVAEKRPGWMGYVDETSLDDFVPISNQIDVARYEDVFRDLKTRLPTLTPELQKYGIPSFFIIAEPHLTAGGERGGESGEDGMVSGVKGVVAVLDRVGIISDINTKILYAQS